MEFKPTSLKSDRFHSELSENKTSPSTASHYLPTELFTDKSNVSNHIVSILTEPVTNWQPVQFNKSYLLPLNNIKLHSLSIPNTAKIFPWVVLLNGRLDTRAIAIRKHHKTECADSTSGCCRIMITITWCTKTSSFVSFLKNTQKKAFKKHNRMLVQVRSGFVSI